MGLAGEREGDVGVVGCEEGGCGGDEGGEDCGEGGWRGGGEGVQGVKDEKGAWAKLLV